MGFLQICCGVILLQLSKSAKDVSDIEVFEGDLDQVRTIAEQEQPESEPKADAIRGTAAIIRRISVARHKWEAEEAKRVFEDRKKDLLPIGENDGPAEWDGLKRRPTIGSRDGEIHGIQRRKTQHPPLGMTKFPDPEDDQPGHDSEPNWRVLGSFRKRAKTVSVPGQTRNLGGGSPNLGTPPHPVPLTDISIPAFSTSPGPPSPEGQHVYGLPVSLQGHKTTISTSSSRPPNSSGHSSGLSIRWAGDKGREKAIHSSPTLGSTLASTPPTHTAKRQFSFQNPFGRHKESPSPRDDNRPSSRIGLGSRQGSKNSAATEEEQLGLVKGDSRSMLALPDYTSDDEGKSLAEPFRDKAPEKISREKEAEYYEEQKRKWRDSRDKGRLAGGEKDVLGGSEDEKEEKELKELEGGKDGGSAFL
jgi:magnesium transporter